MTRIGLKKVLIALFITIVTTVSCQTKKQTGKIVIIKTEYGDIKLKLYDETPLHRDNFIKLIKSGNFNDKIFHRVIKNFMIQAGNPSNNAQNALPPVNYTIPSEFNTKYFHKKGSLAGARKGDQVNPDRATTPDQFYIVQGEIFSPDKLQQVEQSINNQEIERIARKIYQQEKSVLDQNKTPYNEQELINKVIEKAKLESQKTAYHFSQEQIKTYSTIGGTPFLDNNYTVFGEVIEGLEIVDLIAAVKTLEGDKPETEVKFTIKVVE